MNPQARRPFWLALVISLILHVAMLTSPGWGLPLFDDEEGQIQLDATLALPRPAAPVPLTPAPKPSPKRRSLPSPLAAPATESVASPATETTAPVEPSPVAEAPAEAIPDASAPVLQAPTFSHADILPRSGRIIFQVIRGDQGLIVGQGEHRWHHDGLNYELRAITETVGLAALFRPAQVIQESRGSFSAAGLLPQDFRVERDGKPRETLRFDYATGRLTLSNGRSADFSHGTQDLLSLFYQLGAYSFDSPQFAVSVSTGRKVANFMVAVGNPENLDTPLGLRAVRYLKITGTAREDATEIWLDAQTRLPLKIRHRDRKGEIFDQVAAVIELGKTP